MWTCSPPGPWDTSSPPECSWDSTTWRSERAAVLVRARTPPRGRPRKKRTRERERERGSRAARTPGSEFIPNHLCKYTEGEQTDGKPPCQNRLRPSDPTRRPSTTACPFPPAPAAYASSPRPESPWTSPTCCAGRAASCAPRRIGGTPGRTGQGEFPRGLAAPPRREPRFRRPAPRRKPSPSTALRSPCPSTTPRRPASPRRCPSSRAAVFSSVRGEGRSHSNGLTERNVSH